MATATPASASLSSAVSPIVIDLGKKKNKALKALKRGEGKLMDELTEVMERVRADVGPDADLKMFVPIVLIYRKKDKRKRGFLSL